MNQPPPLTGIIDAHFHSVEMARRNLPVHDLLDECFRTGLSYAVDIGTEAGDLAERKELVAGYERVFFSVGLAPEAAEHELDHGALSELESQLQDPRVVAVGEAGLDWYWDYGSRDRQMELFRVQAELANRAGLPLVVHNRDADREVLAVLREVRPSGGVILHCFSSSYETARSALDLGCFISFAGNVTFKNARDLQDVAARIPVDAILVETDAPYLAPHPLRGQPNHPGLIGYTYARLAELRSVPADDLAATVHENFLRAFHLQATRPG